MAFSCLLCQNTSVQHWDEQGNVGRSGKETAHKNYIKNEVRIVILGKSGSGKSSTGNTILNKNAFFAAPSGSCTTSKCTSSQVTISKRDIMVVDTPGLFDTGTSKDVVVNEVSKCVALTSPGPHCFLLVLSLPRFTDEDKNTIDHFVDIFGNGVYHYITIVFTGIDRLDREKMSFEQYLTTIPDNLRTIIEKCNNRYIAVNNLANWSSRKQQARSLLKMIDGIISENNGEHYTNKMYLEAEKLLKQREEEIEKERKENRKKEIEEIIRHYEKEKREEEIDRVNDQYNQLKPTREEALVETEEGGGLLGSLLKVATNYIVHNYLT